MHVWVENPPYVNDRCDDEEMGEPANEKPDRNHTFSPLRVLLGVLIGIIILAYLLVPSGPPRSQAHRIVCMVNLKSLGAAMSVYAEANNGVYPSVDKWCDLLVGRYALDKSFKCPAGGKERCDYAMNPRAGRWSAPDVVLLFESTGGWNQAGGPELMMTKRH